jgi:hypothetical protein
LPALTWEPCVERGATFDYTAEAKNAGKDLVDTMLKAT